MEKQFAKSDLQTGHIVVTKGKGNAILIGNRFKPGKQIEYTGVCFANLDSYWHDLTHRSSEGFNIEKVYKIVDGYNYTLSEIVNMLPLDKVELIWEREREIDWIKVPKFTRVQVKDRDDAEWKNRYFIRCTENDVASKYLATWCGEFAYQNEDLETSRWEQIRIYDKSEIKEEWYK